MICLNIIISNSTGQPIYDQISSQIKNLIIAGELKPGDALPSMRVLAKELRISVITTKRAYEELEKAGFIFSVTGKGSFVAKANWDMVREANLQQIESYLQKSVAVAKSCNLSLSDFQEMVALIYESEER